MKNHRESQYAKYIYPSIYNKPYEKEVQTSIFDDKIETSEQDIDKSNIEARQKGQFKAGNPYRYQKEPNRDQISIEDKIEGEEDNE